jgi:ABC-type transporter Mla subunit MlaD
MNSYVSLILDVIILGVLAATIFYARRLSRQITAMQADRKIFEKLIEAINNASARADAATKSLRDAAQQGGDRLQENINAARALSDELEIIVQAGDSLAERLEKLARRNAQAPQESRSPRAEEPQAERRVTEKPRAEKPEAASPLRTRAEKELLEALRAKQQSS